jgi:hypothetical protein
LQFVTEDRLPEYQGWRTEHYRQEKDALSPP